MAHVGGAFTGTRGSAAPLGGAFTGTTPTGVTFYSTRFGISGTPARFGWGSGAAGAGWTHGRPALSRSGGAFTGGDCPGGLALVGAPLAGWRGGGDSGPSSQLLRAPEPLPLAREATPPLRARRAIGSGSCCCTSCSPVTPG